jgi:hypothetical protein
MKRNIIMLLFSMFYINNIFAQNYDIVRVGDTSYYLEIKIYPEESFHNAIKFFDEFSEYQLADGSIISSVSEQIYNLRYIWGRGDMNDYGIIYFSESSQSNFINQPIIRTFTTRILNIECICNVYKLWWEYTNDSYPGKVFTYDCYYGEIIINDTNKYIHIIPKGYSEEMLLYVVEDMFSTLVKKQ